MTQKMICRLCLEDETEEQSVSIFDHKDQSQTLVQLIEKHLKMVLEANDAVSSTLCRRCWLQILDFEQFCVMVADKQHTLRLKTEVEEEPEPAVVVWNTEPQLMKMLQNEDEGDVKDQILCEPEIEALEGSDATDFEDDRFEIDAEEPPINTTKQLSLRDSRARSRNMKRQQTKDDPPVTSTTKRGRPKAQAKRKQTAAVVVKDTDQVGKRSSIKEMDDYIAANVRLDCCLCSAPLSDFTDLKRHFRSEHDCSGYMRCCNNRYKKRTLYVDHLHYHKDPQYFSCQLCQKNFLNRNSQVMHMLRFHSEQQELVHQCAICEARFAKKYLLTMHLKGHKGTERTEACPECGKTFRTKLEVTAHVKRMHDSDFTPVICDICGTHFRCKANFLIHKKALHPEGPVAEVQCKLCGRWLRDERSLRKHLARHDDREGNNKYRCVLCQAEKSSRVALSSHMRYHHSGKRHKCSLCDKEFKLPRALTEHMATHTGVDLYSCPFCTRTFKSHANMHNHKKKMHPNEWVRKYSQPTISSQTHTNSSATEVESAAKDTAEGEVPNLLHCHS